ncbi:MAG: hypothetical protein CME06_04800 [Gemmatimonadetes bacterium]|nr:hypothetical protein [Gemmatimonadota bacterium]
MPFGPSFRERRVSAFLLLPWIAASALLDPTSMDAKRMVREAQMENITVERSALVLARGLWLPSEEEGAGLMAQLRAETHRSQGVVTSPVIDLGGIAGGGARRGISVRWFGQEPPGTRVRLTLRTGRTPTPDRDAWTAWLLVPARPGQPMRVTPTAGRYLQWKIVLISLEGSVSPSVTRVDARRVGASGLGAPPEIFRP